MPRHDPGGKVSVPLPDGVIGGAFFSECGRYRPLLMRHWETAPNPAEIVWIGLNPSTATAGFDDPTMIRIRSFTKRLGYRGFVMCNVFDYRSTDPKALTAIDNPSSPLNMQIIRAMCRRADVIVAAWGAVPPKLRTYTECFTDILLLEGFELSCLGVTKNGFPRHPLYVRGDAGLVPYRRGD